MKAFALLSACFISAATGSLPPADHNLRLDAPIKSWDEAIPLGNGLMGGLLWGESQTIRLSLDRGDFWDERTHLENEWWKIHPWTDANKGGDPWGKYYRGAYPTKLPGGRLEITLPKDKSAKTFELNLAIAEGKVDFTDGSRLRTFFSADTHVALMQIPGAPEAINLLPAGAGKDAASDAASGGAVSKLGYHVGPDAEVMVDSREFLTASHRHFSNLMAIFPFNLITIDGTGTERQRIAASVAKYDKLGTSQWCGYSFSWMACLRARIGDAEAALRYLDIYEHAFISRNGFHLNGDQRKAGYSKFTYRPFTLEGNFLAMQAVHEMLLQSWSPTPGKRDTEVIRLFPATPWRWHDAAFTDLRAEGGHRISAKRENNATTYFSITAGKDGPQRIRDNFGGRTPQWSRQGVRKDGGDFLIHLKRGETIEATLEKPAARPLAPADTARSPANPVTIVSSATNDQMLYFTSTSLLADDKGIVFLSDRTGEFNIFHRNPATGKDTQLTKNIEGFLKSYVYFDGTPYKGFGRASVSLDAKRGLVYYIQGREIRVVDLAGNERVLATYPENQMTAFTHVSECGTRLCVPTVDARALDGDTRLKGKPPYNIDARVQAENLNSYLRIYDTATGREIACERVPKAWITHVQFSPVDPRLVLYNHEWPSDCGIRRMWLWDGKQHLRLRPEGEGRSRGDWACHEMWERDGKGIIYHGGYHKGTPFIGRVNADGSGLTEIPLPKEWTRYGHYTGADRGWLVTDGNYSEAGDPKGGQGAWISVVKVDWEKRAYQWLPLCRSGSSWKSQDEHPHPIFNHAGDAVYFTSDKSGRRAIYRVAVPQTEPKATP